MSSDDGHWVETLFPPAFGFTVDELLEDIDHKPVPEKSLFEKLASRVHPIDTAAIKNVYQRVWLMAREEQQQVLERNKQDKSRLETSTVKENTLQDADTSTTDLPVDIHDPCIWSSSEIQVLREVFQVAREQNKQLMARLSLAETRLHDTEKKYKEQTTVIDKQSSELTEAIKANTRLDILAKNLNKQIKTVQLQVNSLKEELKTLKSERAKYMQEAHEAKVKYNKEKLERTTITSDLQQQTKESLHQQLMREEKLKLSHDRETAALRRKVSEIQSELQEEQKAHERTKKGLEHLRTHFASLPYSGEGVMVVEDQLKTWTY